MIRMHLTHIAKIFSEGDFDAPMLIHEKVPPGVPVMKELKAAIRYEFQPTERGGSVVLSTKNARALEAVHQFLRFQIEDHKTGDSKKEFPDNWSRAPATCQFSNRCSHAVSCRTPHSATTAPASAGCVGGTIGRPDRRTGRRSIAKAQSQRGERGFRVVRVRSTTRLREASRRRG